MNLSVLPDTGLRDVVRRRSPLYRRSFPAVQRRQRRVKIVWALMFFNVMTYFAGAPHILPIPGPVGKGLTQLVSNAAGRR